jgi:hypothetical protein
MLSKSTSVDFYFITRNFKCATDNNYDDDNNNNN